MAAFDYSGLLAVSTRLITEFGRVITLSGLSAVSADTDKPWEGPASVAGTPLSLSGVFVPPNTVRQFGLTALGAGTEFRDLITFSEQIIITMPGETDIRDYTNVNDGGVVWGIIGIQVLKPGTVTLLAFIGIRR